MAGISLTCELDYMSVSSNVFPHCLQFFSSLNLGIFTSSNLIYLFDYIDSKIILSLKSHSSTIKAFTLVEEETFLHIISGDAHNNIIHWSSEKKNIIHNWNPRFYKHENIQQLSAIQIGNIIYFASYSMDSIIKIWKMVE